MTSKVVILVILVGVLVVSCNSVEKTEKKQATEQVKTEKTSDYNWIYGKTFTQEGIADKNPELGGADFVTFKSKETIELKTGDIVTMVKATFDKNQITLEDQMLGTKRVFDVIDNAYLQDEYGIKWTTK